jgi:HAD superfamily hydrolase (TIGR01490 family)
MKIAAFFDMDGTLLSVNSGAKYLQLIYRKGLISTRQLAKGFAWVLQYKLGILDAEKVFDFAIKSAAGDSEAEMIARCNAWFEDELKQTIMPGARRVVEAHRARGHKLALLTSATNYAADPLSRELQIEHVLCTRLDVRESRFTGKVLRPLCFGEGKVALAEAFAREHEVDLAASFFYTDSISDHAMLARVGEPRIVNPDLRLRWLAKRNQWKHEDLSM